LITDYRGDEYERLEYTPYGELWIEQASAVSILDIPYRFTGKERDKETGLYYFGARYLDARASRWLSVDPAMGEYVPGAPVNDAARKRNENLPGLGGVFNYVNLHVYHYAGNNPVIYVDPDGRNFKIELGIGKGAAAKLRIQYKEGRLTVGIKVGVGAGAEASVSFNNETKKVGPSFFAGTEGNIGGSVGIYDAGISAEISIDGQGIITNEVTASASVPGTGLNVGFRVSDGQITRMDPVVENGDVFPAEFGASGMVFAGVGYETTVDFSDLFKSRE